MKSPNSDKWFVLLNPFAAGGKAKKKEEFIRETLSKTEIEFLLAISGSRKDATDIIHGAIENGFRKFIAVGGDGTLNSLVNGIFSQKEISPAEITISIIPLGTGNDWIKSHQIPASISKAISIIKQGKSEFHDVGLVRKKNQSEIEERYFINVAGFAFQGLVAARIEGNSKWLKIGFAAFVLGLLDALWKFKTSHVKIDLSEEVIGDHSENHRNLHGKFFNISAGIGKYAGGGMKLTPNAITDDGLFDITIAGDFSRAEVLQSVPGLFSGSFVLHSKISRCRTKQFSISSSPLLPIETDGEVFGYGDAEVIILEKAIQVMVP